MVARKYSSVMLKYSKSYYLLIFSLDLISIASSLWTRPLGTPWHPNWTVLPFLPMDPAFLLRNPSDCRLRNLSSKKGMMLSTWIINKLYATWISSSWSTPFLQLLAIVYTNILPFQAGLFTFFLLYSFRYVQDSNSIERLIVRAFSSREW